MSGPLGEIAFPSEWLAGKTWKPGHPQLVLRHEDGTMFAAGGVLNDGTDAAVESLHMTEKELGPRRLWSTL